MFTVIHMQDEVQDNSDEIISHVRNYQNQDKNHHLTTKINVKNNTLKLEDSIIQDICCYNNQIEYKDSIDKIIAINNTLNNLSRLTEAPIKSTETELDKFILTDTLKSQIQGLILSGNIEIITASIIIFILLKQINNEVSNDFIGKMYKELITASNVYDFENRINQLLSEYGYKIHALSINLEDIVFIILQSGHFNSGIPQELFGIENTNEKNICLKEYNKALINLYRPNMIKNHLENANQLGLNKEIKFDKIDDNVFKLIVSQNPEQKSLRGIIFLFNGEVIDENSNIYRQLVNSLQSFSTNNLITQLMNMISGSSSNFDPKLEQINHDKRILSDKLSHLIRLDRQIETRIIYNDKQAFVTFDIHGIINNKPITQISIDNEIPDQIKEEILDKIKNVFEKYIDIYSINLDDDAKISYDIESILNKYGISFESFFVNGNEVLIKTTNKTTKFDKVIVTVGSLSNEQNKKLEQAAGRSNNPVNLTTKIIKDGSFGEPHTRSSSSSDGRKYVSISSQFKQPGINFHPSTKDDLIKMDGTMLNISILSFIKFIEGIELLNRLLWEKNISSLAIKIVALNLDMKTILVNILKDPDKALGAIKLKSELKLFSFNPENLTSFEGSAALSSPLIQEVKKLLDGGNFKISNFIKPELKLKAEKNIFDVILKCTIPDFKLSLDLGCKKSFEMDSFEVTVGATGAINRTFNPEEETSDIKTTKEEARGEVNLTISNPHIILHSKLMSISNVRQELSVPFEIKKANEEFYASISILKVLKEIFNTKQLLGQEIFKCLIIMGVSGMFLGSSGLDWALGFGIAVADPNGSISMIIYVGLQNVSEIHGGVSKNRIKVQVGICSSNINLYNKSTQKYMDQYWAYA